MPCRLEFVRDDCRAFDYNMKMRGRMERIWHVIMNWW